MTDEGVQFAATDGRRSSSATAREVLRESVLSVDAELAAQIQAERSWHRSYPHYLRRLTEVSATSLRAGHTMARAGLDALHERFEFVQDGQALPLLMVVAADASSPVRTETVTGSAPAATELVVPFRGERLSGQRLHDQLWDWVGRGLAEPSFACAVDAVIDHPEWLDLSGRWFGLLGGGAEMSPLGSLLQWGAEVAAVDLPRPGVWQRMISLAEQGSGRLHVPVHVDRDNADDLRRRAGLDLLTDTPAARQWLAAFPGPLVLGNYAYADGAEFVRVAMAADAIATAILTERHDVSLAYLATPTDVFAVPPEVVSDAKARTGNAAAIWRAMDSPTRRLTRGRSFVPHYHSTIRDESGRDLGVADTLIVQQGPNYALAKRLQRWRAIAARGDGIWSSAHIAPPTRTASVLKNRVLAAAYAGAPRFGVVAFEPATSSALMAAVLVHDLRNPAATANPSVPLPGVEDLFMDAAAHGGVWRLPWEPRSVLPLAVLLGSRALLSPARS